jgi:tripartite-type tricarboxylate transporter receptor subunit TctC
VPGYVTTGWQSIAAPKNTPVAIIDKINKEVNLALVDPKFTARLLELGGIPFVSSPTEFGRFIIEVTAKWTKVIREGGIKAW